MAGSGVPMNLSANSSPICLIQMLPEIEDSKFIVNIYMYEYYNMIDVEA